MNVGKATLTPSCAREAPLRALHSPSGTMAPTLAALLGFGLSLCWETWAQQEELPKPSLRAEPSSVVPQGQPVILWCKGSPGAGVHRLRKTGSNSFVEAFPAGQEAWFIIYNIAASSAGSYQCLYQSLSGWSEPSEPLELTVTGLFPPPSLSAWPSSKVAPGQAVTLQCHSQLSHDRSALYKVGEQVTQAPAQPHARASQANFSIPAVNSTHGGTYRCYSFWSLSPHEWSFPSDALELRVTASAPASSALTATILLGLSALLILLFLLLLLCCRRHRARIGEFLGPGAAGRGPEPRGRLTLTLPTGNGSRGAEAEKTPKSSDPAATPMEEPLYAAVEDGSRTPAGPEDTAAPPGEDPRQVTYAQLKLKAEPQDPPGSGPGPPCLYAALR
uniref:Ig-like domain-containing protein n=1 Tax=Sarcophilus harrisii TaxID=9305 RepID=A0A7N4NJN1_SARHA